MKHLMTGISAFLIWLAAAGLLSAQHMDSVEGDFIALQALYNSTQGNGVEVLNSEAELPDPESAEYPYMYIINEEIHALTKIRIRGTGSWKNYGAIWKDKAGWDTMTPETMGDAVGVTTDSNGRVTILDMQKVTTEPYGSGTLTTGNGLIGILTPEIGNLKKMQWINLKQNFFHGEIPDVFEGWNNLERWSMGGMNWELNLDSRTSWNESDHLRVNYDGNPFTHSSSGKVIKSTNNFKTKLPLSLDGLQNLELIEAAHQYLEGPLPEWGDMPSILGIYIPDIRGPESKVLGTMPESWGNLTNTQLFRINNYSTYSRFTGQLPDGMKNWTNLANFAIGSNSFSGPFPQFTGFTDLVYFTIGGMEFTGEFPWSAIFNGKNARLSKFSISNNFFTGTLPQTIPEASMYGATPYDTYPNYRLDTFSINSNNFNGNFPEWPTKFSGLQTVNISYNNFTGSFPEGYLDQNNLKTFRINDNNFSGPLPAKEWGSRAIPWFQIQNNNFEGVIPDEWKTIFQDESGNYHSNDYARVMFHNNNLSGRIPDWGKNLSWSSYQLYTFNGNRYTFKDILPVYEELRQKFGENFRIDGQKPFGESLTRSMPEGSQLVIDLSDFHYEGNTYQWIKDNTPLVGENSPVLEIQDLTVGDEGAYRLEVSNSALPELGVHVSEPIIFELGDDDGLNDTSKGDNGNDDGTTGSESGGSAAFPSAPMPHGPGHVSEGMSLTPEFSWSDNGADYYILHVSRRDPTGMQIDVTVVDTTYTPDEIFDDGTIHDWRVRGVKDGELGEWSDIRSFTTGEAGLPGVAELVFPGHFAQQIDPAAELVWEDVEADSYEIRLMTKVTGELLFSDVTSTASYAPAGALPDTTQFIWQIKSITGGVHGAWGPRWEFTTGVYTYSVDAPSLIAPDPGSEYDNLTPVFEWNGVEADHYVISVTREAPSNAKSLPGMQDETVVILDETTETQYMPQDALDPETQYYWRVQAVKDGEEGEWSDVWEFTTPDAQQSVSTEPGEQPFQTTLAQNYPNPFNPSTQIEFTLSAAQNVSLRVYDMAGRQVATLAEGVKQAGKHTATFSANHLASGIYIYRFMSDTHQFTRKMTLLK
jgi:hypothetical protein